MTNTLKTLFLLDPNVTFLNHGSFGATPRPVFEAYQDWQRLLERQPVLFLGRDFPALDHDARQVLGTALHTSTDDLVFIPNATHGVNIITRALHLSPGDEILTTDHEYGACDNAWRFICNKTGAQYIRQPIPVPFSSQEAILESLWQGVSEHTRVIYVSHITSPTAVCFPVEAICARARQEGILTVIDGAHAPGQIPLDLPAIGADFYFGNCHKWMLSPKGAGFLYARPEVQGMIEPLIVSWGYSANSETTTGSTFVDLLQWAGTRDPAAALSVPAALLFMEEYHWEDVRQQCHEWLMQAVNRLCDFTGLPSIYPNEPGTFYQMASVPLPELRSPEILKTRLYDEFSIEIPILEWNGQTLMRISVQGYNTIQDLKALIDALEILLPQVQ